MARSVPKCKRAAHVYDRDFIVVDDISGVLKMRSECAIDGYGFLSSQGDMRNPQEIPPIINEQMAAWPDPRPIGQPVFTPSPDYQYFLFNYFVSDVAYDSSTFDATASVGLNAPIASIAWSVDGVYVTTGLTALLTMIAGAHDISVLLTDLYGNEQTFTFEYTQPNLVKFLGHFDGTNGATAFVDSSGNNVTITTVGTAQLSTSIKKFGTASLYLPANTAYTTIPSTVANFAGKDFCIELWVYPITKGGFGNIIGHNLASTSFVGFNLQWEYGTNKIRFLSGYLGGGIWTIDAVSTIDVLNNVWSHIAVTREGQVLKVFINGVKAIEINSASTLWAESNSGYFGIGVGAGNNRFGVGYIDEVRIVEGNAVYTANFTPPTSPF